MDESFLPVVDKDGISKGLSRGSQPKLSMPSCMILVRNMRFKANERNGFTTFLEEKQNSSSNSKQSYKYDFGAVFRSYWRTKFLETSKNLPSPAIKFKLKCPKVKFLLRNQFLYSLYQKGKMGTYRLNCRNRLKNKSSQS